MSTTFGQLVAGQLSMSFDKVEVERVDTGIGGIDGTGAFVSRSAVSGGGAVSMVTDELRTRLLEDTGEKLEAAAADLELVDGAVQIIGSPSRRIEVGELVAALPSASSSAVSSTPRSPTPMQPTPASSRSTPTPARS